MPVKGFLGEMQLLKSLGEGFSCPTGEGESEQCLIKQRECVPCAVPTPLPSCPHPTGALQVPSSGAGCWAVRAGMWVMIPQELPAHGRPQEGECKNM